MTGDFTRWTYTRLKNYSAVLMQQGRVLLDADWNEQRAIDLASQRTLARDLIGHAGGPIEGPGFAVATSDADGDGIDESLLLRAGHYYVDGVLCELHADTPLSQQPALAGADPAAGLAAGRYAVYLDVWERDVTYIQDERLKEKALGGPDHTLRTQVVAQARLLSLSGLGASECATLHDPVALPALIEGTARGQLAASRDLTPPSVDPCIVPASAGYRGLENQLYRVEIHRGGTGPEVTFKWSRDNASVLTAWDAQPDPTGQPQIIQVADLGPDAERGFGVSDQLVELFDDANQLTPSPGLLARVESADEASRTLTLKDPMDPQGTALPLSAIARGDATLHPRVRRWDNERPQRIDEVDAHADGRDWIELEDGLRVSFEYGSGRVFRSGDYWLIPARTIDGSIDWEPEGALQNPHGHQHRYACLAIVRLEVPTLGSHAWSVERPTQTLLPAASSLLQLHYAGGDGQQGVLGAALPMPLSVQVLNGGVPAPGIAVRFRIEEPPSSNGSLVGASGGPAKVSVVTTGADGRAQVRWTLADEAAWAAAPHLITQSVRATLLGTCGGETDQLVVFSAHESQARETRFADSFAPLAQLRAAGGETDHVQIALDLLFRNPQLDYVGGDGQEALPGAELPNELVVRVGQGAFAMSNVRIEFELVDLSDGSAASAEVWAGSLSAVAPGSVVVASWPSGRARVVRVPTDAQGLAWVRWQLGSTPGTQRPGTRARIVLDSPYDVFAATAASVRFGAQWTQEQLATCGELVIRSDTDIQALFDGIVEGGDARICVHPGVWRLERTLEARNKGNLIITGAGAGTRFVAAGLDRIMLFASCRSVSLRDLTVATQSPGIPGSGLQGALSFLDCNAVDVERVRVRTAYAGTRRVSGIQVWNESDVALDSSVRIHDSQIETGHGQTGILVADVARSDIQANHVQCTLVEWSLARAIIDPDIAVEVARTILDRPRLIASDLFQSDLFLGGALVVLSDTNVRDGTLESLGIAPGPGRATLAFAGDSGWPSPRERRIITWNTPIDLAEPDMWEPLLLVNPMVGADARNADGSFVAHPEEWYRANLRRLRVALARAAFGQSSGVRWPSAAVQAAFEQFAARLSGENNVTAGGQGIVVGGRRAPALGPQVTNGPWNTLYVSEPRVPSVRVTGNTISGFAQGIHIGTSFNLNHQSSLRARRLRVYRARVADNTVSLRVPGLTRERHGVFVGNAQSVQVIDNMIELTYPTIDRWSDLQSLDGVRLWGSYGPMLHVRGNHTVGPSTGVRVHVRNAGDAHNSGVSWLVRDNAYAGNGQAERLHLSE